MREIISYSRQILNGIDSIYHRKQRKKKQRNFLLVEGLHVSLFFLQSIFIFSLLRKFVTISLVKYFFVGCSVNKIS